MLKNQLFGMFICGTLVSSCTGAISQTWWHQTPLGAVTFSRYTHHLYVYVFVTFWEVITIDPQPQLCP